MPAGSLQFVDFSKPDPGAERVERFMTAAKHALAEGDFELAARRLVYARDAEPEQPGGAAADDARVLAGGRLQRRRRAPCATGSAPSPSAPRRTATPRASTRTWARCRRRSTPPSARPSARPTDASAWERLGRLRLRRFDREGAREALERARAIEPTRAGPARPRARRATCWATSAPRSRACEQATQLAPDSAAAWSRLAHALARTDRASECLAACDRALALRDDPEVRDLREQVLAAQPRAIEAAA